MSFMSCCVQNCFVRHGHGVPLHRFPNPSTDQERFQVWVRNVGGEVATLGQSFVFRNKRICHKHFHQIYFGSNNRLSKIAVPSISESGLTVHSFPNPSKFPEQFRIWVELGGEQLKNLSAEEIYPRKKVCDKHFIESHRNRNNRLNAQAIPTFQLPHIAMHVFPNPDKFPERFKAWVNLVGGKLETLSDFSTYKKMRICDIHFTIKHKNRYKRLNNLAVPSLYLPGKKVEEKPSRSSTNRILLNSSNAPALYDVDPLEVSVLEELAEPKCDDISLTSVTSEETSDETSPTLDPLQPVSEELAEPKCDDISQTSVTSEESSDETSPTLDPLQPVFQYSETTESAMKPDICQICLRTDRILRVVDDTLSEFHAELCDYYLATVDSLASNSRCCLECAYLLRKLYNFKVKCKKADKLLKKWMEETEKSRMPTEFLYTLLTPSSLGPWRPENNKTFAYAQAEKGPMTSADIKTRGYVNPIIRFNYMDSETSKKDIKVENECESDETELDSINSSSTEDIFEDLSLDENLSDFNESDDNSVNCEDESEMVEYLEDLASDVDEIQTKFETENSTAVAIDKCDVKDGVKTSPPKNKTRFDVLPEETEEQKLKWNSSDFNELDYDSVNCKDKMEMVEYLEDFTLDRDEIQDEYATENNTEVAIDKCDIKDGVQTSPPRKKPRFDVLPEEQEPKRKSLTELTNISLNENDYILNDRIKQENISKTNEIKIDDAEHISVIKEKIIHQYHNKHKRSFTTAIPSVKDMTAKNGTEIKLKDLPAPANAQNNNVAQYYNRTRRPFTNKDIIATLTNVTQGDATLVNLDKDTKEDIINMLNRVSVTRKVPLIKIDTSANNDIINKLKFVVLNGDVPLVNLVTKKTKNIRKNAKNKLERIKRRNVPYTKERLLEMLKYKFENWRQMSENGELKYRDGTTIDMQLILHSVENKATERLLRQLWKAVYGNTVKANALKIFKLMQNKYRNDHKYASVFDIEYLNTEEKMREEFEKRKTYECYLNAEYKCEQCYQPFKYEKLLEYHRKCHHDSNKGVVCPICTMRHRSRMFVMAYHEAVYKCKLCPLVTYYRGSMINHYHQHLGKQYRCDICDVTYKSYSAYLAHTGRHHRRGQHICTVCGRAFYSELGLKGHKTRMHKEYTPSECDVRCEDCKLDFPTLEVYLTHVRNAHVERVFKSTKTRILEELPKVRTKLPRIQKPRKQIVCRVCNATGSNMGWMNHHFAMEHPSLDISVIYADTRKHLCHICGKGFMQYHSLSDHLDKHSAAPRFPCPVCPKRFYSSMARSKHRFRHLPPGFPCSYCGKKFRSQANRYSHVRTHIGDRRFKCIICGKGFLHRAALNEHVRGVHYQLRRVKKKAGVDTKASETSSSEKYE